MSGKDRKEIDDTYPVINISDIKIRQKLAPNAETSQHERSRAAPFTSSLDEGTLLPSTVDQTIERKILDSNSGARDSVSQIYGASDEGIPNLKPKSPLAELGELYTQQLR